VTCNDILKRGLEDLHFTEEWREIKLVITAVRNTHFIVYWYIEGNTDLHKGDVIVQSCAIVFSMGNYFCSIMNSSTSIGVSGARPHREIVDTIPVDSKISLFVLSVQLIECYIINYTRCSAMNIACVYKVLPKIFQTRAPIYTTAVVARSTGGW
jgi:hypothetical protein